jgi:hypothetical protein
MAPPAHTCIRIRPREAERCHQTIDTVLREAIEAYLHDKKAAAGD